VYEAWRAALLPGSSAGGVAVLPLAACRDTAGVNSQKGAGPETPPEKGQGKAKVTSRALDFITGGSGGASCHIQNFSEYFEICSKRLPAKKSNTL
jgi:hypothetical protein